MENCDGLSFGRWNLGFGNKGTDRYGYSCSQPGMGSSDFHVYQLEAVNGVSPLTGQATYDFNLRAMEIYEIVK